MLCSWNFSSLFFSLHGNLFECMWSLFFFLSAFIFFLHISLCSSPYFSEYRFYTSMWLLNPLCIWRKIKWKFFSFLGLFFLVSFLLLLFFLDYRKILIYIFSCLDMFSCIDHGLLCILFLFPQIQINSKIFQSSSNWGQMLSGS